MDAGNADMHNWHMNGRGKKIVNRPRKRNRGNVQA